MKGFAIIEVMLIVAVMTFFGYAIHTAAVCYKTPTDNVCVQEGK
jgi:hypothetical protein